MSLLETQGLSLSYPQSGFKLAVDDLRIDEGSFVLLSGDIGSGKSSFLQTLIPQMTNHVTKTGQLTLFGAAVENCIKPWVSFVCQRPSAQLVCDTVYHELAFNLENLGLAPELMRKRIAEISMYLGLQEIFCKRIDDLSGGQKQLVSIAAALAVHPRLLVLDEPTASLDAPSTAELISALQRVNREQGLSIVLATHDPVRFESSASHHLKIEGNRLFEFDRRVGKSFVEARTTSLSSEEIACMRKALQFAVSGAADAVASKVKQRCEPDDLISLKDADFAYPGQVSPIIKNCSVSVISSEVLVLLGANGSGKSTLLKILGKALRLKRGKLGVKKTLRCAYLPQDVRLLFAGMSVYEELDEWSGLFGYGKAEIEKAIRRSGLADCVQNHPFDLSGGQQSLLALEKLLLTKPEVLLLDEPSAALDPNAAYVLAKRLRSLAREGMAVVCTGHDLAFAAAIADRLALLFDGAITVEDEPLRFFEENYFLRPSESSFTQALILGEALDEIKALESISRAQDCVADKISAMLEPSDCSIADSQAQTKDGVQK